MVTTGPHQHRRGAGTVRQAESQQGGDTLSGGHPTPCALAQPGQPGKYQFQ